MRPLLYRNQAIDLLWKSMDWFLYDNDLRHERVNSIWDYLFKSFPRLLFKIQMLVSAFWTLSGIYGGAFRENS